MRRGGSIARLSGVLDYSARVAAAVGAMMCVLMRVRDADALARACDLGLAMQLTNIARDVGEDARAGRLYLPLDWLAEAGMEPAAFLRDPRPDPARSPAWSRQLLAEAESLYFRSEAGVAALPADCRPGIFAARRIYAGIGAAVARNGHDSVTRRARTGRGQKIGWLMLSVGQTGASLALPRPARLHAAPAPEVAFLVQAAARAPAAPGRAEALLSVLAQLEAQDQRRRAACCGCIVAGLRPALHVRSVKETAHGLRIVLHLSRRLRRRRGHGRDVQPRRLVQGAGEAKLDAARLGVSGGLDDALPLHVAGRDAGGPCRGIRARRWRLGSGRSRSR